jgi:hypothetical protein
MGDHPFWLVTAKGRWLVHGNEAVTVLDPLDPSIGEDRGQASSVLGRKHAVFDRPDEQDGFGEFGEPMRDLHGYSRVDRAQDSLGVAADGAVGLCWV